MSSWAAYQKRMQLKGDFKIGDRVKIKPKYLGTKWSTKMKRSGDWILKEFKTANWVLKRPDDYTGYYTQGLLAKAEMLELVEAKTKIGPPMQSVPPSIHVKDEAFVEKFVAEMTKADPPNLKSVTSDVIDETYAKFFGDKKPEFKAAAKDHWGAPTPPPPSLADPKKDIITYRPGMVCLVKNPDYPDAFKGLYAIIEHGNSSLTWIAVAPLFGGTVATINTKYIIVIPKKDLTITYLPQ